MTRQEALEVLKYYQNWLRGGGHIRNMPDPNQVWEAIDVAIAALAELSRK